MILESILLESNLFPIVSASLPFLLFNILNYASFSIGAEPNKFIKYKIAIQK